MRNCDAGDRESGNRTYSDGRDVENATKLLETPAGREQSSDGSNDIISRRPSVITFGETTTAIFPHFSSSTSNPSSVGALTVPINNNSIIFPLSSYPQSLFRVVIVSLAIVQLSIRLRPDCESLSLNEEYYNLLVTQEKLHRSQASLYCTQHTTMYMIINVASLRIFVVCLTMYVRMDVDAIQIYEQVMFAESLMIEEAVPESDKLLRVVARPAGRRRRAIDNGQGRRIKR